MSAESQTILADRQVTLLEAFLYALATHAAILVILSLLGLLGLLTERQEPSAERDMEVRFTVAPEPESEPVPKPEVPAPAGVQEPPTSEPIPPADNVPPSPPETAEPDPQARPSLDPPRALVVPVPPSSRTGPVNDAPPADEPLVDTEEPSARGVEETREPPPETTRATDPIDVAETDVEAATDSTVTPEPGVHTQLDVPPTADGDFTRLEREPARSEPPPPGRPDGPSIGERLTDFSRAVQRAREAAPAQPEQAPQKVFEPDWSNLPANTGQVLGNMHFEHGNEYDFSDYQRQIYWIIWRAWHNRLLARVDDFEKWAQQNQTGYMEHVNVVRFTIERNGEISSISIETESDSIPFDLSAVEGLDEAVLPPLPADYHRDRETVHAQFIGQGDIALMRRGLQRLKQMGVF